MSDTNTIGVCSKCGEQTDRPHKDCSPEVRCDAISPMGHVCERFAGHAGNHETTVMELDVVQPVVEKTEAVPA